MNHEGASAQLARRLCHSAAEAQQVKEGQQMWGGKGLGGKGRRCGCGGEGLCLRVGRAGPKLGWRGREGAWLKLSEENR